MDDARIIREFVDTFELFEDLTISREMKLRGDVSTLLTTAWGWTSSDLASARS
jgi:hypothetical protein